MRGHIGMYRVQGLGSSIFGLRYRIVVFKWIPKTTVYRSRGRPPLKGSYLGIEV